MPQWARRGGGQAILKSNFLILFLASYGLLTCIGVGENATYHLERPVRVPNPSLFWGQTTDFPCILLYCTKFQVSSNAHPQWTFFLLPVILKDKTQNLRPVWGPHVSENHAQKLGFLSQISHIGHCGRGRVDFERNPIKLPIFTHGARRAKVARSLIDARGSNAARGSPLESH